MRGLIIPSQSIDKILTGHKTCEIRSIRTHIRGTIGLIKKGTGTVIALCEIVDCVGPLSSKKMRRNIDKHDISPKDLNSNNSQIGNIYAWVLKNIRILKQPVKYRHKSGVATWHPLSDSIARKAPLILRARTFSPHDLEIILRCVDKHFRMGRTYISKSICKELGWKQPNGWLKDRACRDVLIQLEEMRLVVLPSTLIKRKAITTETKPASYLSRYDLITPITTFPEQITLEFAKSNEAEKIWNELVEKYHYLGHKVLVGRCIKYLVKTKERLLGGVAFSSPAWRLNARDILLPLIGIDLNNIRDLVINNSRFLILPNVKVPNLASTVLSLAANRVLIDWTEYYSIVPQVAETFVQPSKYLGTCYKAANWIEVGITKGYAKRGASYHNSQEPKQVFLYGLNTKTRRELLKAVFNRKEASKPEAKS